VAALAAALVLNPLVGSAPAAAADPGAGSLSVSVVDDRGQPVVFAGAVAHGAGPVELAAGTAYLASTTVKSLPVGTYGIAVLTGWGGLVCRGFSPCTPDFGTAPLTPDAVTVSEGTTTSVTLTSPTPTMTGTGALGQPLTVVVPSGLTAVGDAIIAAIGGEPASFAPKVAWRRDGAPIGATGLTYRPTSRDAGHAITAVVTFPPKLAGYYAMTGVSALVPTPLTTAAVAVPKATPELSVDVPRKVTQGRRPTVFVEVDDNAATGPVRLAVTGARTQVAPLRSGLARFRLPVLKPGRHRVTVTYRGSAEFEPATATATITVTKARKRR